MSGIISGNMVGGAAPLRTLILTDVEGNELVGVVTGNEQILTANASTDIREGTVAVTDKGIETGSAFIPNYVVYAGTQVIDNGNDLTLHLPDGGYDYTKLQAIICGFNTSLKNSVSAEHVVIEDQVFPVQSTEAVSLIVKNAESTSIDFGITNISGKVCLIRYFMYKELY